MFHVKHHRPVTINLSIRSTPMKEQCIEITRDEFKYAVAEVTADMMDKVPNAGATAVMLSIIIGVEIENKLFNESEEK